MKDFIVIPTYNERKNIEMLIPKIFAAVPDVRVMVVDDDSPDGTQETVRTLMASYPNLELFAHNQKAGFARAYTDAFDLLLQREVDARSITMMDADLSHDPDVLPRMMEHIASHDVVVGSRYVRGGGVHGWEWWRRALSGMGNIYLRMIARLPVRDITSGFNCIRADLLRRVDYRRPEARGYAFQFVLKHRLLEGGASLLEIPILFRNRMEGESKLTHHIISEAIFMPWKMKWLLKK